MITTEPRFRPEQVVSLVYGMDVHVATVVDRPRAFPGMNEWTYPLRLVDGRRYPALESELRPGGRG